MSSFPTALMDELSRQFSFVNPEYDFNESKIKEVTKNVEDATKKNLKNGKKKKKTEVKEKKLVEKIDSKNLKRKSEKFMKESEETKQKKKNDSKKLKKHEKNEKKGKKEKNNLDCLSDSIICHRVKYILFNKWKKQHFEIELQALVFLYENVRH